VNRTMAYRAVHRPASRQSGVTLIEILVAMVLLGVGLLGLAGLQLRGMQVNQGSMWRSQAAVMAEDLADRLRADPSNAQLLTATGAYYGTFTPASAATFTPMSDWLAMLAMMPGGSVATAANLTGPTLPASCAQVLPCALVKPVSGAAVPTPVQIEIYWNDARAATGAHGAAATDQIGSFTMIAELSSAF